MSQPENPVQMHPQQSAPAGWTEPPAPERPASLSERTRAGIIWAVVGTMLIAAAFAAIGALNRDVYGAGAFVGDYLSKLQEKDAAAALRIPGVPLKDSALEEAGLPEGSSNALLRNDALPELSELALVDDVDEGGGLHSVTWSFESNGRYGESTFVVKAAGTRFPFMPVWAFEQSPLAVVNLAVQHATVFTANGFDLDTRSLTGQKTATFDNIVNVQVFTPGAYVFESTSEFVTSDPESVLVDEPTRVHEVAVEAAPTEGFVAAAQEAVNAQLDACTEQKVLQPTGCPFGIVVDDRILGDPLWSFDEYPEITVEAGAESWVIPAVRGDAHLEVDVQSLFDGSVTAYDADVPFSMIGNVYVMSDGTVQVIVEDDGDA